MNDEEYPGLTSEQAYGKAKQGLSNSGFEIKTKSVKEIFFENIFTFFNLLNLLLAVPIFLTGKFKNALFLAVAILNSAIGIIQALRAKRALDKLTLISSPHAQVVRDGKEMTIPVGDVVEDDLMILSAGSQVCADAVILSGECEADESLLSGESEPVFKEKGGELHSGSFIVSGCVKARAVRVGAQSSAGKITSGAKYLKKSNSEIINSINKIIKIISVFILPIGVILFIKAIFVIEQPISEGVTSSVAALIGMIPEGLVLLTQIALALSAIRLSKRSMLCRDLCCVEALAQVDVLCLDKTGTLTEGKMEISDVKALNNEIDVNKALCAFAKAFPEENFTLHAIKEHFSCNSPYTAQKTVSFSSARKWSAAQFDGFGTMVLGAADRVLGEGDEEVLQECKKLSESGLRVLVLARSSLPITGNELPEQLKPAAIISLSDVIRSSARETLSYFQKQGVCVKIISGDDPACAAHSAKLAGLAGECVDMTGVPEEEIPEIVDKYTIFGRTSPQQKVAIIKALKAAGHKVAMTGDGVNDILALREADCSAAMQSGSDAARAVAQLVLTNSDFSSMPTAVAEGRRCINNIRRSASLFLTKTVFSAAMAVVFLFLPMNYPLIPIQITLIGALAIGIPSFLLTLEPNFERVKGDFLKTVLKRSAPAGISAALGVIAVSILKTVGFEHLSAVTVAAVACFGALFEVCQPINVRRGVMLAVLYAAFAGAAILFPAFFGITAATVEEWAITATIAAAVVVFQRVFYNFSQNVKN